MLLSKIIAIILAIATLLSLINWIITKKENWGIATITSIIAFAAIVLVTTFTACII